MSISALTGAYPPLRQHIRFGQAANPPDPIPPDKQIENEMMRYQAELDSYLRGQTQADAKDATSCCATLSKPDKAVASPAAKSPFQQLLKSPQAMVRAIGKVLDWFYWFFNSLAQDVQLLLRSGKAETKAAAAKT